MRVLRLLRHRLRSLIGRRHVEDELDRELAIHIEQLTREHVAAGVSEAEARRLARLEFGSPEAVKEQCRDTRRVSLVEDLFKDVRYGSRLLAKSPAFTITAIVSLALGIGANTAIFSLIDAVLLRSVPVERPHELVFFEVTGTDATSGAPPYPAFDRIRTETTAFADMAAFASDELRLEVDGTIEQVFGQVVSGGYFNTLGVSASAGRVITTDDARMDPPVAVIGYGYWQRRFGGDPQVIGKVVRFEGVAYTIVGVTPPEFWGLIPGRQIEVTLPMSGRNLANPEAWWFDAVARVKPGVSVEQATAQADRVFQSFMTDYKISAEMRRKRHDHLELLPAAGGLDTLRTRFSRPLLALMLLTGLALLIACGNLGTLLLARGSARTREFAIRLATGAGAGRLFRQLLTETLLLFIVGAIAGLLVASFGIRLLTGFFAIGRNPIVINVDYDWRLAGFAVLTTLVAAVCTGLWPAVRAMRTDPQSAVKDHDTRVVGGSHLGTTGRLLIAGQVALSLVLLVTAVMFARTLGNLRAVDFGFRTSQVLTMSLDPIVRGPLAMEARQQFWRQTLDRVRALPGVSAASLSVLTPLSGRDTGTSVRASGFQPQSQSDRQIHVNHVSDDYFRTFGVELRAGRVFSASDDKTAPRVAMINQTAADFYFNGRNPIDATLDFFDGRIYRIVGVVKDAKHRSVREPATRFVFIPLWQPIDDVTRISLAVASNAPLTTLPQVIGEKVRAIRPGTLLSDVISIDTQIDAALVSERLLATLSMGFAALALGLAAIGLYGTLSYTVARRRAEFGIRIALGALPSRVASGVVRNVLVQVLLGIAIGVPLAIALTRTTRSLLFGVTTADLSNYVLSTAMLIVTACLAAWLPARRAAATDPAETLRRG
jgi:predicted permease